MNRTVRRLGLAEIQVLLGWAAAEGWNPGIEDALPFQAADPDGFIGAFVDGIMVAGISAVAFDRHFGFIGLYICHPDWRGRGHGKAVWDSAMAYLGDRTIGLDGVPEQQANYARMGFVPAYETIRMSGLLPEPRTTQPPGVFDDIVDLDRQCFPAPRAAFLRAWTASPRTCTVHRADGAVDGFAITRACHFGRKMGPLFCRSVGAAMNIVAAQSGLVHIDVPAYQIEFLRALSRLHFEAGFTTRRMYRGRRPAFREEFVFGVSTLELG